MDQQTNTLSESVTDSLNAGIGFWRQGLTSKADPRTERIFYNGSIDPYNIGIQMKREELTKTFISVYDYFKSKKNLWFL